MFDWNKIIESHVVKNFQKISLKWWGIDIRFYDASGNAAGNQPLTQNPLCRCLLATDIGAKKCTHNFRKHCKVFKPSAEPIIFSCYAGVQWVAAPIFIEGNYTANGHKLNIPKD